MNQKRILTLLLASLGACSLALTGCGETKESPAESTPAQSTPAESTPAESTPSESTPDESTPAESTPDESTPAESTPDESTPDESTPTESTPGESTPEESTSEVEPGDEVASWEVIFNYDDTKSGITVWTEFPVEKSVAPDPENISKKDLTGRHTVPLTGGIENGNYYIAVDAAGYVVYMSYGTGAGFGTPCDGYYYNTADKGIKSADYWSLHDQYDFWPKTATVDGKTVDAWTLFDFLIPQGGFVVKGLYSEANFREFYKELIGDNCPSPKGAQSNAEFDPEHFGSATSKTVEAGSLNGKYVYLNEDRELVVRDRTDEEIMDADGEQEEETYGIQFTTNADDELESYLPLAELQELEGMEDFGQIKGVIIAKGEKELIIQDEEGNCALVYKAGVQEEVGDTIIVRGTTKEADGFIEAIPSSIQKVEGFGTVEAAPVQVISDEDEWFGKAENLFKKVKLEKAEVVFVGSKAVTVKFGDEEVSLYQADGTGLKAGDKIEVVGFYKPYGNKAQLVLTSGIRKFYKVTADTGTGVEESHEVVDSVTLTPSNPDVAYIFVEWQKLEGEEWVKLSSSRELKVVVDGADVKVRAVYEYAPWTNLDDTYQLYRKEQALATSGDSMLTVWTYAEHPDFVLHDENNWAKGSLNASWRTIAIFDAQGKVVYCLSMPANGYGGPHGTWYGRHSDYADYKTNPAFEITYNEDGSVASYKVHIPQGGFAITGYDGEHANKLLPMLLTEGQMEFVGSGGKDFSTQTTMAQYVDKVRVFFDRGSNEIRSYYQHLEGVKLSGAKAGKFEYDEALGLYTATATYGNWNKIEVTVYDKEGQGTVVTNPNDAEHYAKMSGSLWSGAYSDSANVYPDDGSGGSAGLFVHPHGAGDYVLLYDLENNALRFERPVEHSATLNGVAMSWNYTDGVYEGLAQYANWGRPVLVFTDKDGNAKTVTNPADAENYAKMTGKYWSGSYSGSAYFYAEDGSGGDPGVIMHPHGANTLYRFIYNPETNTLEITDVEKPTDAPVVKDYTSMVTESADYKFNYLDEYQAKIDKKVAEVKQAGSYNAVSNLLSEIFYDNENAQMWADSGFSSIVYTDNAKFQSITSAWGGDVMVVNADGKIEFIGNFFGGQKRDLAASKGNYYLRAANAKLSPVVADDGLIQIPEGGFAIQIWYGTNSDATHKLAYSNYDVLRSLVFATLGSTWYEVGKIPADHVVGNTGTEATRAYGENNTLSLAHGAGDIRWSNAFTGYLDNLTVTKEAVTDAYFKGKLVVKQEHTIEAAFQNSLVKTEIARLVIGDDDAFAGIYNGGGVNWCLSNVTNGYLNKFISGEVDYAKTVSNIEAVTMGTSYCGDTYVPLWNTLKSPAAQVGQGVALSGGQEGVLTWNGYSKTYSITKEFGQWNRLILTYTDAEGTAKDLTAVDGEYGLTCTITGDYGRWDDSDYFYPDNGSGGPAGVFTKAACTATISYNPETNTVTIKVAK